MAEKTKTERKRRPTLTAEEREDELISLAVNLAEKQLRDGTAKSQVIVHYLKMASTKEKYEKELLEADVKLRKAKADALEAQQRIETLYKDAMDAFTLYSGGSNEEIIDD